MADRMQVVGLYVEDKGEGVAFLSQWHDRLEECVTDEERRLLESLLGQVSECVYGVMVRDLDPGRGVAH